MPYKNMEDRKTYGAKYRKKHRVKINAAKKVHYKQNTEKLKLKAKIYRKKHIKEISIMKKLYYEKHKDRINKRKKKKKWSSIPRYK